MSGPLCGTGVIRYMRAVGGSYYWWYDSLEKRWRKRRYRDSRK